MSEYVTKPIVMVVGVAVVLAMFAAFAVLYSNTGIGGSTISSYASSVKTTTNSMLPYIVVMVAGAIGFTAAMGRRRG